jgi:plastocyanin
MRSTRLVLSAVLVLAVLTGCGDDDPEPRGAASPSTPASSASTAPPTKVAVRAGLNDPEDLTIAALAFLPATVAVAEGAAVTWTVAGPEPHSVTFFPPGQKPPTPEKAGPFFAPTPPKGPWDGTTLVNSGLGPQGPGGPLTFELTFAKAGSYGYVCVIHPQMQGTVTVGAAGAESQADIDARGKSEADQWLAEGRAAKKALLDAPAKQTKNANGSTTWTVLTGASTPHTDVLAFSPTPAKVKAGDTVMFVNSSGAPHTATFPGGTTVPQNPEDPKVLAPAPGKSPQTLRATGYFNTGWLPPDAPPGAGPPLPARSFSFVIPKAGTYNYVCVLHAPSSMVGAITAT